MDIPKGFAYKGKDLVDKLKDLGETSSPTWKFVEKAMESLKYDDFKGLHNEMEKVIKGIYQKIPTEKLSQDEKLAVKHLYMAGLIYATNMIALHGFTKPSNFDDRRFVEEGAKALCTLDNLVKKAEKDGSS